MDFYARKKEQKHNFHDISKKKQWLLMLIVQDMEVPLYTKNKMSLSVYSLAEVMYCVWWIINIL